MVLPAIKTQNTETTLSPEEGRALFERAARREPGISGAEFLERWDAGEYVDTPDTPEGWKVMRLSFLMSFVRPES